jgi:hypothetical protein
MGVERRQLSSIREAGVQIIAFGFSAKRRCLRS